MWPIIMPRISIAKFRELVAEALDDLPEEWATELDNVFVVVEEEPSPDDLAAVGVDPNTGAELLGLYQGVPLDERGVYYSSLPDRVVIYRGPILRATRSRQDIVRVIRETVLHELGHHFGLAEEDLPF
jgi:predicted Zn-dependent protease with MMP-like domain